MNNVSPFSTLLLMTAVLISVSLVTNEYQEHCLQLTKELLKTSFQSCSLGVREQCQSRYGKTIASYCSCGTGLTCFERVCVPDGSTPEYQTERMKILETGPDPGDVQRPLAGPIDITEQRPIADLNETIRLTVEELTAEAVKPEESLRRRPKQQKNQNASNQNRQGQDGRAGNSGGQGRNEGGDGSGGECGSETAKIPIVQRPLDVSPDREPIVQRPVASGPRRQRPLNGPVTSDRYFIADRDVILACSLPLGSECQSTRGKTLEAYCSCAEKLKCVNHICEREDPNDTSPVLTGRIRTDRVGPDPGGQPRQRPIGR